MARPKARRSTEVPELLGAQPWEDFASDLTPAIAQHLGISPREVERAVSDPERIAARVRALPGIAIAVLELLVDADGELDAPGLLTLAQERLGIDERALGAAFGALARAALAFTFMVGAQRSHRVGLLDVSAATIASLVRGLTLPDPPAAAIEPGDADTQLRDDVAALATLAHVPVRINKDGRANLTSAKKLAAVIGRGEQETIALLERASDAGVLGARGTMLAPRSDALRRLARGDVVWAARGTSALAYHWTPSDRWIAREALIRALTARDLQEARRYTFGRIGYPLSDAMVEARNRAGRAIDAAGLLRLERDGHVFVRRRAPSAQRSGGDGHVTPSFEVMLGPDADPELAAIVALAAEPVRFDRVITRKLTPASIAAALAEGLTIEEVTQALERVGRHGLADNVRAMIADWARSARTVRVRRVWALEASTAEAADLAARALGASVVSRPTPTLVLVDGELATPDVALSKTSVKVSGAIEPILGAAFGSSPIDLDVDVEAPPWLERRAAPELRARARDTTGLG
nr:helicase-associated domain-containing protein [Myxococcota bacterium]